MVNKMTKLKRYLLFAGDYYYPSGGMNDFVDSFDSIEEAVAQHDKNFIDSWKHVYDCVEVRTVLVFDLNTGWKEYEKE